MGGRHKLLKYIAYVGIKGSYEPSGREFDKFAGSEFEHQRFLLMARRADHREVICNLSHSNG